MPAATSSVSRISATARTGEGSMAMGFIRLPQVIDGTSPPLKW
jgi:hypothetical protein